MLYRRIVIASAKFEPISREALEQFAVQLAQRSDVRRRQEAGSLAVVFKLRRFGVYASYTTSGFVSIHGNLPDSLYRRLAREIAIGKYKLPTPLVKGLQCRWHAWSENWGGPTNGCTPRIDLTTLGSLLGEEWIMSARRTVALSLTYVYVHKASAEQPSALIYEFGYTEMRGDSSKLHEFRAQLRPLIQRALV